jgi:hypothetical protein
MKHYQLSLWNWVPFTHKGRFHQRSCSSFTLTLIAALFTAALAQALPVKDPALLGFAEQIDRQAHNPFTLEQLSACVVEEKGALVLDLYRVGQTVDGRTLEASRLVGEVCAGPWPFMAAETGYAYRRFRLDKRLEAGQVELPLKGLFNLNINSEAWTDTASVLVRLDLRLARKGADEDLMCADLPLRFHRDAKGLHRLPALLEGPLLCKVDSRRPGDLTVALKTDLPAAVAVEVEGVGTTPSKADGPSHEVALTGLPTDCPLRYRVLLDGCAATEWLDFRLPGAKGKAVRLAYFGDSREADGGGDRAHMGINLHALELLLGQAHVQGAEALLFGGDLISGYTIWPEDFRSQLQAWKQAALGFWRERPVFTGIGNHETLLRIYKGKEVDWLGMDRWPYATQSAEALFAREMCNPENGPEQPDTELPGYAETVFSTRLGCVTAIFFNNTWWYNEHEELTGGCPQGHILEDQLQWLEEEIRAADADPACRHILFIAHEPPFPMGGHVKDSMWHGGDNGVRPWRLAEDGQLVALAPGIVEQRNRLVRLFANSPKSAAVLAGHEHAYARLLLTPETPAGDPARDDADGDGRLCETGESCSPVPGLKRPLWFLIGGGASPYYAKEPTPWASWWEARPDAARGSFYTSQEALLLFDADERGMSLRVLNPFGEEVDRVENLRTP